jgi:hypothetical protein
VGGPHLHLCLDGSGPAVEVHLDGDGAGPLAGDAAHDDRTFEMSSPVLSKTSPPALDGALLLVVVLLVLAMPGGLPRPAPFARAASPAPPFLRPPLRGPPA